MKLFLHAHASHPQWGVALAMASTQLAAQCYDVTPLQARGEARSKRNRLGNRM